MNRVSSAFTPRAGRVLRHTGPLRGAHSRAWPCARVTLAHSIEIMPRVRISVCNPAVDLRVCQRSVLRVSASPVEWKNALTCANAKPQTTYTQVNRHSGDFAKIRWGHALSPTALTSVNAERQGAQS